MNVQTIKNRVLKKWIEEITSLCQPKYVYLCNGSQEEYDRLANELVEKGTFIHLNETKHPHCFLSRSHPDDVARVESRTFICSEKKEDAGPTNNWEDPRVMLTKLKGLFKGCMRGRTLYIIPYSMGPVGSPLSHIGVQITDSAYVVCNMRIMTRIGQRVLEQLDQSEFVPCLHSVGVPLANNAKDDAWPCNPKETVIAHFPESKSIWSFGSGYGGNALLGKKCFALRIASVLAKDQGWLAEHMLILGITNPKGEKKYFAAAFPSQCGKTNLAMMNSKLPGWKIECVGDDIAWMKWGSDGQLYAINPEAGFFGVAPGTSAESNPNALASCRKNSIFTNVALTDDKDVWWEGLTKNPPEHLIDWLGKSWTPASSEKAAHSNSRFTSPASQCPIIDPLWEDPKGVPISAIIFGGRRGSTVPLVYQSFDWEHGVFFGASISSETTSAAQGEVGKLRHDPFAMLPFCGYHMGDYFNHWLSFANKGLSMPKIFAVNWFQKNAEGKFLWPGYGENTRVLKWIFERCENQENTIKTPIGYIPQKLDLSGLTISDSALNALFEINKAQWLQEVEELRSYFKIFGSKLPKQLSIQLDNLESRL